VNLADYLRREFVYDAWANQEVLSAILAAGSENTRSVQLLTHILAAERVWYERLKQVPQSVPVWPSPDLAYCGGGDAEYAVARVSRLSDGWRRLSDHFLQKYERGIVDERHRRHPDTCGDALGVSSWPDCEPHA
jgi:uncharacterized damage-inducible protein DinB